MNVVLISYCKTADLSDNCIKLLDVYLGSIKMARMLMYIT